MDSVTQMEQLGAVTGGWKIYETTLHRNNLDNLKNQPLPQTMNRSFPPHIFSRPLPAPH